MFNAGFWWSSGPDHLAQVPPWRPTPASFFHVFHSGSGMRKIVFQVIQYKPFQILVESFVAERVATSPSVFHFRNRQRFQVPGFEWVHELLLFCLASNPAQFCAEISCGKTGLGHNFTLSESRMKKVSRDSGVGRESECEQTAQEWSWHTLTGYKFKYFSKRQIFFVLCYENLWLPCKFLNRRGVEST